MFLSLANLVYLVGSVLNCIVLFACCRPAKWKHLNNMKYLIVNQSLFALLVIVSSVALMFKEHTRGHGCTYLPALFTVSLSLAIFHLTAFVVVKHLQIVHQWSLRFVTSMSIPLAVLVASIALEFPVLYTAAGGYPIFTFEDSPCINASNNAHVTMIPNVSSYAFFHIVLQFIVPAIIIISRCLLIGLHLRKIEAEEHPNKLQRKCISMERWVDMMCAVAIVSMILFPIQLQNNEETLNVLNNIFQPLRYFFVSVFCIPVYLWDEIFINSSSYKGTAKVNTNTSGTDDDERLISA